MATNNYALDAALKQAKKNDKFLATRAETSAERIGSSLRELERAVIQETAKAGAGKKTFTLARAQQVRSTLAGHFDATYGRAARKEVRGYAEAAQLAGQYLENVPGLSKAYITISQELLDALQQQGLDQFAAFGEQARNRIAQGLYNSVVAGWPFERLANEIAGALTGHKDVRGRPLEQYARVYAQDGLMEVYAATHQDAARRAGLTHYLYYGTAVRDSRPFCLARIGKVYTAEEVASWESQEWAGKKPGPILVVRGGWNCRHQLLPVAPEWVEDAESQGQKESRRNEAIKEAAKAVAREVLPLAAPIAAEYAKAYAKQKAVEWVTGRYPEIAEAARLVNAISRVDDLMVMHAGPKALMAAMDAIVTGAAVKEEQYVAVATPDRGEVLFPARDIVVVETVPAG